ncbi:LOW QUALITY PROTEIN: hypothetical protein PHMEG_00010903 [Phytophthora megakarya]|uniref:Uncharacterized protein n=1 Tax=Phytophthora megakarya TaxID=4795 RepID=A0A225WD21_9STRA|nr:LOW QUALITY PROTEIN: hypothetical protein PHMEG_00010903 [Phytophthora megakarya]
MNTCSCALEMQLLRHPNFKTFDGALKKMNQSTNLQTEASQQAADRRKIIDGARKLMEAVDTEPTSPGIVAPSTDVEFSEDIMELSTETADEVVPPPAETRIAMHMQRVDEELDRRLTTPSSLQYVHVILNRFLAIESPSRSRETSDFFRWWRLSCSQCPRRRSKLRGIRNGWENGDAATQLVGTVQRGYGNRSYVDITQCPKLSPYSTEERLPSNLETILHIPVHDFAHVLYLTIYLQVDLLLNML